MRHGLDALSLTNVIIKTLEIAGIDPMKILSQCYDGASCMSGDKGVQRILHEKLGKLIPYIYCFKPQASLSCSRTSKSSE